MSKQVKTSTELNARPSFLSWFNQKGYLQGVFWIIVVSLVSNMNDILTRKVGSRLPPLEVAFFRFFFAVITLLPVMISKGRTAFKSKHPGVHALRSVLLYGAIVCWSVGVTLIPLAAVSTLALTVPIFVLPMAVVFLQEKVGVQRTIATLVGFCGILIVVMGGGSNTASFLKDITTFNNGTLYMICACVLFALSDIINKKMVVKESTLSMMFYIALGTTAFGIIPAYTVWMEPTLHELVFLFLLGAGANLILFFLLKAFAATDVSALAPYRYVELLLAGLFGFLLFNEIPTIWTLVGASIIVPSTFAIAYYETKKSIKNTKAARSEILPEAA
ncbi:MAG: DMT family transporter [Candidatus Nucleicultricaceae bacterium]